MFFQKTALLALAASASAHLIMQEPAPFEWEDAATKQSPLAPADFPCKQPKGTYAATKMNSYNAGDTIDVKIIGGATHGGGSCQFSLTTDVKPTTNSQWKVIHSQIGNCPGGPTDNNLSNNATDASLPTIPVKLPGNLPAGQYTFAWSWLNKIGNREFYMNCAPITVGGGSSASAASADVASVLGSNPDMFVINLPATECENTAYQDFNYPKPGDSVVTGASATPGASTTGAGCAKVTVMGAGNGKLGEPAQATGGAGTTAAASKATTAAPASSTGQAGGVFAPGASSAATTTLATHATATQPAATQTVAQPTGTGVAAPTGNGSSNSSSGGCTPCTTDGAVVCIGSNQFGLCNRGCAVAQDLAAGMSCANGQITRRGLHFPRAHLHRRHGSRLF